MDGSSCGGTDHLNTPRLVADAAGTTVWRWDQAEPFGDSPANEDPDANSVAFDLPLRLPGQRYDAETALHYNYFRDYDPSIGRFGESDPIGLRGGFNAYAYGQGNPLSGFDPDGLAVVFACRLLGEPGRSVSAWVRGRPAKHCYVHVTCPSEGIDAVLSLFGESGSIYPSKGRKAMNDARDTSASSTDWYAILPKNADCLGCCKYEKEVLSKFNSFPSGWVTYDPLGWNSNSFAEMLVTSPSCRARVPYELIGTDPLGFGIPAPR